MNLEAELAAANEALQDALHRVHGLEKEGASRVRNKAEGVPLTPSPGLSDRAARVNAALAEAQERENTLASELDVPQCFAKCRFRLC